MKFARLCAILAAKRCRLAGMSVKDLAKQAGRSQTTIRRWLAI